MEKWKDDYFEGFGKGQFSELKVAQADLEQLSSWDEGVSDLSVLPLENPMEVEIRALEPTNTIPKEVLLDTCDHAGIMLAYEGKEVCLRECAMPSLLNTTGISGLGVGRVNKYQLATGLTAFLSGSREKSKILHRAGKVAAVLSRQYEYMAISQLLDICGDLETTFGTMQFLHGAVSHAQTTAEFAFPDSEQSITAAYNSVMQSCGRATGGMITPIVQFRASDTSSGAAMLITYLRQPGNILLPLGTIKVSHTPPLEFDANGQRLTCMEKFRQEAGTVFSKMGYDIATLLPKMLDTPIHNPGNCFVGLCKYAGIPQKWGGLVEEDVRLDWEPGSDCTMLDIYESLARVTGLAIKDGFPPYSKRVLDLEEGILKVANNLPSWTKYDLPGTVAWSQNIKKFSA